MNWKEWFQEMKKFHPAVKMCRDDPTAVHWENLYQAFKARLIEELGIKPEGVE